MRVDGATWRRNLGATLRVPFATRAPRFPRRSIFDSVEKIAILARRGYFAPGLLLGRGPFALSLFATEN